MNKNKTLEFSNMQGSLHYRLLDYAEYLEKKSDNKILFISLNSGYSRILIRSRENGDIIRLESGKKKIKNLLIDLKMHKTQKDSVFLVDVDSEIAACIGSFAGNFSNRVSLNFHVNELSKKILAIQLFP